MAFLSKRNFLYFFLATVIFAMAARQYFKPVPSTKIITAPVGKMRGVLSKSRGGRDIVSYRGIPYAQPPVGKLRFAKTQPLKEPAWEGVRDADTEGSQCPQAAIVNFGNCEDCLVLNLHVPDKRPYVSKELLPVMVFIHGGGFVIGPGSVLRKP